MDGTDLGELSGMVAGNGARAATDVPDRRDADGRTASSTLAEALRSTEPPDRGSVDTMLNMSRLQLMQISSMADGKANIMITVSSIMLSIALTQYGEESLRWPLFLIAGATSVSLFFAVLAVLPAGAGTAAAGRRRALANPFYFQDMAWLEQPEHEAAIERVLATNADMYGVIAKELHAHGSHLARRKFRYLRWSYGSFVVGIVTAFLAAVVVAFTG